MKRCETCKWMGSDPDGAFCSHPESMKQSSGFGLSLDVATSKEYGGPCVPDLRLWEKDPLNRAERFARSFA